MNIIKEKKRIVYVLNVIQSLEIWMDYVGNV
jgi:hypothetical protein